MPEPTIAKWPAKTVNYFMNVWKDVDPKTSYYHGDTPPTLAQKRKAIAALLVKKPNIFNRITRVMVIEQGSK